ncbi:OppA family ABC transporter substrate-binding lipoprotein [Mycoplasmopsis felifaucium]|uniref:Lipoprotein n=1 Tax=Mycoplasmopsis felifaucium TaxID=35768 RepID=A0ABZ2RQZ3_9BACT
MFKKILPLITITTTVFVSSACNIRESRDKSEYIKSFNKPSYISSPVVNKSEIITNDHQSLLSAPLVRWKYVNNAKFDKINKNFSRATSKFLSFGLAKSISVTTWSGETIKYDNDLIEFYNSTSKDGIVRVYSENENNINNHKFFENLTNAKKISFELKDEVYYVDRNAKLTNQIIKNIDYWNSYTYKNNYEDLKYLLEKYDIKELVQNKPIEFESAVSNSKNLYLFLTNEICSNNLFTPLYNKNPDIYNMKFASKYVLNEFDTNQAKYLKNIHSWDENFNQSLTNLKSVKLKFNPVPIDEPTYRLQSFNSYKQNLISEVPYNLFNETQQKEIDEYSKVYGLNFEYSSSSFENVNKYFYNLIFENDVDYKFNNNFSKLVFSKNKKDLKGYEQGFYNKNSYTFLNLINNIHNQYIGNKILGHNKYWNSYISQSAYFDIPFNETDKMFSLVEDFNNLHVDYYDLYTGTPIRDYSTFDNFYTGNTGLIPYAYEGDKIIDLNIQFMSPKYNEYAKIIRKILDDFMSNNADANIQRIEWTIPVFSEKNYKTDNYYSRLVKLINGIDHRLNVKYDYADKNDKSYIYQYKSFNLADNSVANHIYNLIDSNNSLLINIFLFMKQFSNEDENMKPVYYHFIKVLSDIIQNTFKTDWFAQMNLYKEDGHYIFDELLKSSNLSKLDFQKSFINSFNSQLSKSEQFNILRSVDDLLLIRQNEYSYLFVNEFEKVLVQYFYTKPLNDQGFTYYQDISVY